MLYLTRKENFNAAHRLWNKEFSDAENNEIFGKCANPNWHGHNYDLYVTIKGIPNPKTGFVMNVRDLGKLVREHIISKVDHRNLNIDVDFLKGQIPTTENIAVAFWQQLEHKIPNGILHCVKLCETETIYVEYFGEPL